MSKYFFYLGGNMKSRNPDRLDNFYNDLKIYHKKYAPDLRFFQLLFSFLSYLNEVEGIDPFYLEENQTIEYARKYFEESGIWSKDL